MTQPVTSDFSDDKRLNTFGILDSIYQRLDCQKLGASASARAMGTFGHTIKFSSYIRKFRVEQLQSHTEYEERLPNI
jgi:hypothetical protein